MPHRLVNLQSQLRTFQHDVERALRALVGAMQRNRFFADAASILDQLQLIDQLIAFILPLPAKRVGIGSLLNFTACKTVGDVPRAGGDLGLMNVRAFGRIEPLLLAAKIHIGFGQSYAFHGA